LLLNDDLYSANGKTNRQEIDHKSRASQNLGKGQRSYSGTGCGAIKAQI